MKFYKYCGAGNDFVLLPNLDRSLSPNDYAALARRLCDRHFGVGADGLMIVEPPEHGGDCKMVFYNNDGSTAEMCGNGARCICRFCHDTGLSGTTQRIETPAGPVVGERIDKSHYRIELTAPTEVKRGLCIEGTVCDYIELGEPGIPHAVVPCETAPERTLRSLAERLRHSPSFPRGANVNFCAVTAPNELRLLTYERGVEDFTLACGTGTGASVLAMTLRGAVTGIRTRVVTDGGVLSVDVLRENDRTRLFLTGEALCVFTGETGD